MRMHTHTLFLRWALVGFFAALVLGSSKLGRFTDVETLAEATLAYLSPATSTAAQ